MIMRVWGEEGSGFGEKRGPDLGRRGLKFWGKSVACRIGGEERGE
jgi:hypothetical protein